mgnify:CR=1 FL=1
MHHGSASDVVPVFFLSDSTGISAETMGNALLLQFPSVPFERRLIPFLRTVEEAREVREDLDVAMDGEIAPLVFLTVVDESVRQELLRTRAPVIDFVSGHLAQLEAQLGVTGDHAPARLHGVGDSRRYNRRMQAVEFAIEHDDGQSVRAIEKADVVLIAPSRCGKTPTSMYLALMHGIFVANYPLVDEDLQGEVLPRTIAEAADRCFGLLTSPQRLSAVRSERRPDIVQYCVSHMGELWLFGLNSIAVWYNAGTADFPFRERVGGVQDRGVGQLRTIATLGNSLVFLADDRVVYRTQGYQLVRISDHALEEKLSRYSNLREIAGCAFVWEGHEHYALKLPNAPPYGKTFVYDASTQAWHERSSEAGGEGIWRVDRSARFGVVPVFGSATEGRLYLMDAGLATDDGVPIRRRAVLPPLHHEGARAFLGRVEIDMEVGTGDPPGSVHLTWSDDGGSTWSAGRHLGYGAAGETRKRVVATRLGSFRQRLLAIEASHKLALWGVNADVQVGAH